MLEYHGSATDCSMDEIKEWQEDARVLEISGNRQQDQSQR
jgi:hypothetical protein